MENITPFSDAVENASTSTNKSEVDILRDSNRKLKLKVIELEEKLNKIKTIVQ